MNSKNKNLLKITDFAKLCDVNRKTLIYYDTIGLFSPVFKDDNGYRYYSYHQYDTFSIITSLKEIHMPLSEIKNFIDNRSPELLVETLSKQKTLIKERIDKLLNTSKLIDSVIDVTKNSKNIDFNKIYLDFEEEEYFILSEKITTFTDNNFFEVISKFINYCATKNLTNNFNLGAIVSKENLLKGNFTKPDYLFVKSNSKIKSPFSFTKPRGKYLTAYHIGNYDTTATTYARLFKFMEENNLKPLENSYELELLNFLSYSNSKNYVTKISILVE